MVHDRDRIDSIRKRTQAVLNLISELKTKCSGNRLEQITILAKQVNSFDALNNAVWDGISLTPANEKKSLDGAEHMLQIYEEKI